MRQSSEEFNQQSRQQAVQKLQDASRKLAQAQDPSEQSRWAQEVRQYSDQVSAFSGSAQQRTPRTAITIEAVVPSPETFQELAQQIQSTPGLKEMSYRREGGTPRVRIQATHEALPQIQQVLEKVGQTVLAAYSGSSSSS